MYGCCVYLSLFGVCVLQRVACFGSVLAKVTDAPKEQGIGECLSQGDVLIQAPPNLRS